MRFDDYIVNTKLDISKLPLLNDTSFITNDFNLYSMKHNTVATVTGITSDNVGFDTYLNSRSTGGIKSDVFSLQCVFTRNCCAA